MAKDYDFQHSAKWYFMLGLLTTLVGFATEAVAATCTSKASGIWRDKNTWSCVPTKDYPVSADTVILVSPHTVSLSTNETTAAITINAGATLDDKSRDLTVNGNAINNGTFGISGGSLIMESPNSTLSGTGNFVETDVNVDAGGVVIPVGSTLNFANGAQLRIGNNNTGSITLNGVVSGVGQASGDRIMRVYSGSGATVNGTLNAPSAYVRVESGAVLTNNGAVTLLFIDSDGNNSNSVWNQGANSALTLSQTSYSRWRGTLNAAADGNTVTFVSPGNPTDLGNTRYYNLSGSGVVCPLPSSYVILGTSPCSSSSLYVQGSPTICTSVTGVGTIAWGGTANAYSSNDSYATATNVVKSTVTNYLSCTGFNLAVPAGATISGVTVYSERKTSGGNIVDAFVYLIKGGSISTASNAALTGNYSTIDEIKTHGGQTSLWGTTWTAADLNAANFGVAFSSKNTSTTSTRNRTVSVDHIQVRVDYTLVGLHHMRIEHDGTASSCAPEPITLKACANAICSSLYTSSDVTGISLSPISGSTWTPGNTVTVTAASGGINSGIQLARASGTATLAITGISSPAAGNAFECYNTATRTSGSCSLVFSDNSFSFNVPDHTAGTRQVVTVSSCSSTFAGKTRSVKFWSSYLNPAAGTLAGKVVKGSTGNTDCSTGYSNLGVASASATTLSLDFGLGSSPQATFGFCYPDVGAVQLNAQYNGSSSTGDNGVTITGADNFVAKPDYFAVSNIKRTIDSVANPATAGDATGPAFIKAGDSTFAVAKFTATVTAKNAQNASTPNFGLEVSPGPAGVTLTSALVAPIGGNTGLLTCKGSITGCVISGGSSNFTLGATTITDLAWNEVGVIRLMPKLANGDYLGAGEVSTPTASANIGRFYPDRFGVTTDPSEPIQNRSNWCDGGYLISDGVTPCAPAFTYMGEQMNAQFVLTTLAADGQITRNYTASAVTAQNFAKLDPAASGNPLRLAAVNATGPTYLSARLDTALTASGIFDAGQANISAPLFFTRLAAPDGPYAALKIGVLPSDSDGVTVVGLDLDTDATAGNDHALVGTTEVRYGRMWIPNAYGTELLPLPISAVLQYHNGTNWVTSVLDNETRFNSALAPGGDLVATVVSGLGSGLAVLSPGSLRVVAGVRTMKLAAPGVRGSANISLNSPSYLPSTVGRATFGVYKSPLIYRRENY